MGSGDGRRGTGLFLLLAVLFAAAGILAILQAGEMGMEERFAEAFGLPAGEHDEAVDAGTIPGIPVEGSLPAIAAVTAVLLSLAGGLYFLRRSR